MKSAIEVLKKAVQVIKRRGWARGFLHEEGDGFCALGAIYYAAGVPEDKLAGEGYLTGQRTPKVAQRAIRKLRNVVQREHGFTSIASFNDMYNKDMVIAAFEQTIKEG